MMDEGAPPLGGLDEALDRVAKLEKINRALMGRVERSMDFSGTAFSLFQTAILLEDKVKARTRDVEHTLETLSDAYRRLEEARDDAETAKQNLTAAIEAISEGFALFDDAGELVLCNAPFRALMPDIGPGLVPGIAFETAAELFSRSGFLVLDQHGSRADWRDARVALFHKPNASFIQQFAGDRWVQISNKKTRSGATVIFQTDITGTVRRERVRRERELDEQSKILQAAIDHLPQGVCMFSRDLRLRAWNSRFVELLALPVRLVEPDIGLARVLEALEPGFAGRDPSLLERISAWAAKPERPGLAGVELVRADGVILSVSATLMPDGGIVATFADVTRERQATAELRDAKETLEQRVEERTAELRREVNERRAIEAELVKAKDIAEEANTGKTRFLAAASHDLLQPLNAARLFLSLLLEAGLDGRQSRLAGKADMAFASVEKLLEALLDISRFDAGGVETNVGAFPLGELIETLAAEFAPLAGRKGLTLVSVPVGAFVRSDQALLRRIIQNLLSNAIRYTEKGKVLLGARRAGAMMRIEVWDTGSGIPAGKTSIIFEEFRRLHGPSEADPNAMGLGLAIVDRAARLLGHPLRLRSEPGRGSCFSIAVPAAPAGRRGRRRSEESRAAESAANLAAIVIENDLRILEGMVELLESRGVKAIPAVTAEEAAEAFETLDAPPDILLADYHLESGTGLDAIRLLRQAAGSDVPAIIITADHTQALQNELAAEGVGLLWKPVKTAQLFDAIARAARRPEDLPK